LRLSRTSRVGRRTSPAAGGDIFRDVERMNRILARAAHVQKVDILFSKRTFA
jgi:hypothetical protein